MLRRGVKQNAKHTDDWITQTPTISETLGRELRCDSKRIECFPFFDRRAIETAIRQTESTVRQPRSFVYVSDARPHKNHRRLIEAWRRVQQTENDGNLYVTISRNEAGCSDDLPTNLHLLGAVSWEESIALASRCEYVVFPSLLETIGLGIVEGVLAGCKAIIPNDACFDDIVKASLTFDAMSVDSIANSIREAIRGSERPSPLECHRHADQTYQISPSKIVLPNRLDAFVEWLMR
nr:glycosyltransferase [Rhodopirellula sp. JC639]